MYSIHNEIDVNIIDLIDDYNDIAGVINDVTTLEKNCFECISEIKILIWMQYVLILATHMTDNDFVFNTCMNHLNVNVKRLHVHRRVIGIQKRSNL